MIIGKTVVSLKAEGKDPEEIGFVVRRINSRGDVGQERIGSREQVERLDEGDKEGSRWRY